MTLGHHFPPQIDNFAIFVRPETPKFGQFSGSPKWFPAHYPPPDVATATPPIPANPEAESVLARITGNPSQADPRERYQLHRIAFFRRHESRRLKQTELRDDRGNPFGFNYFRKCAHQYHPTGGHLRVTIEKPSIYRSRICSRDDFKSKRTNGLYRVYQQENIDRTPGMKLSFAFWTVAPIFCVAPLAGCLENNPLGKQLPRKTVALDYSVPKL